MGGKKRTREQKCLITTRGRFQHSTRILIFDKKKSHFLTLIYSSFSLEEIEAYKLPHELK